MAGESGVRTLEVHGVDRTRTDTRAKNRSPPGTRARAHGHTQMSPMWLFATVFLLFQFLHGAQQQNTGTRESANIPAKPRETDRGPEAVRDVDF